MVPKKEDLRFFTRFRETNSYLEGIFVVNGLTIVLGNTSHVYKASWVQEGCPVTT